MLDRPKRRMALAAALAIALLPAPAYGAEPSSTLEGRELERLLEDLDADVSRLRRDVRRSFETTRRWEPMGTDRELWEELDALQGSVDRVRRDYFGRAYPGMADDVVRLLERGRAVDRLVDRVELERGLREQWGRTDGTLAHLARSYGWDYERGVFTASAGVDAASRRGTERRSPAGDDREVRAALAEVNRLSDLLATQLRYQPIDDPKDTLIGLGVGVLQDVAGTPRTATAGSPLQNQFAAFDAAAEDALRRFDASGRASDVGAEVRHLLRLADDLEDPMTSKQVSRDVRDTWEDLRGQIDRLAAVYEAPAR